MSQRRVVQAVVWSLSVAAFVVGAMRHVPAQSNRERGERAMNASCQGCHDTRRIQTQAMDADGWTKTIQTMVEKGATVATDDMSVLVAYLVDNHGPMPDGAGKDIVLNTCTLCHDLRRIKRGRRSAEEWEETLNAMLNEGAPLSDDGFPIVHAYLSRHFGAD